jgi:hypothetical protein
VTAPIEPPSDANPPEPPPESRTRIIRRAPTGPVPTIAGTETTHLPGHASDALDATRAAPQAHLADAPIWWRTDRLFCLAVAFLALVFALATVSGVILLLQRRPIGRYLIVAGAVVAVLTYGGVFIAGARVAWIVHALPLLPLASVVLALHPQTKRWLEAHD